MSTKSQRVVEISTVVVKDGNSVGPVNTSKVFVKGFDSLPLENFYEMIAWCRDTLYHGGHYEPNWSVNYPNFYFTDEREYTMFLLRWT
jgi:hypothetical protein